MKLRTTLLATGAIVATGIVAHQIRKRRAFARWANDPGVNDTLGVGAVMEAEMMNMGIADVDPSPMTQISGEGIDPDVPTPPRIKR